MIDVLTWENAHFFGPALVSQHRLRYRLFVERQGWDIPCFRGMEYDQFDTPAAVYLLSRGEEGEVRGITRLIPTTRPYMIKDLWSDFVEESDLPASPDIWEGTRFGVDQNLEPKLRDRVVRELVLACLEFGLLNGIRHYLVLMPVLIIRRVIGGAGCQYVWLGEPRSIGKHRVAVARVTVSSQTLHEARRRFGAFSPILNHVNPVLEAA